jgi:nitroimidazol reductase NimA-like FMN-containing flavoprotein (pyridoxamine 5'-phosphate oxidase superfamily)
MTVHDIRTGMELLEPAECWVLLGRAQVGRLAVSIANHPDIFPVNHVVADDTVVFRTAEGTKLAAAILGQEVAFEVDGYEPSDGTAWSVVIKGRAHEIEALDELMAAEDLPLFPWHASPKARWVRIQAERVSGRRFHVVNPNAERTGAG